MSKSEYSGIKIFRRLLNHAKPYWAHIFGIFILSIVSTPLALLTPLPLKIAVDSVIQSHPIPHFLGFLIPGSESKSAVLALAVGLTVAIALLAQIQGLASSLLKTHTGQKLVLALRTQLFRHCQRLSLSYHDTKGTTDSAYRIQYDAPAIQWIAIEGVIPFVTSGLTLIGMIYITARIDLQLALVALAVSPVLFIASRAYSPRIRRQWREVKNVESSAFSVIQEVLSALRVVKAFGQEEREKERYFRHSSEGFSARLRVALSEGGFGLVIGLTTAAGTAAVLFIGVHHVQKGILTLGDLLLVMSYVAQLFAPLSSLSRMTAHLQGSLVSAERVLSLLDEDVDVPERKDARPISRAKGVVRFCDVSFAYNRDYPVLKDVSFEINPGSRVGIMGMTGAGKTTLVSLLTRFYDPTDGQILLDGIDLRDYKLVDLRNQFAIVLQEPVLFSTSIAENIAYARPSTSMAAIEEAAKAANAHDFITRLPQGYDTPVGERGMQLSGGERQRIALARAFLKNAPLLILDEPTSSVDVKTEAVIMDAMERLMKGRTTFMIAHRLSTLENCDTMLTIQNGRLVNVASDVSHAIKSMRMPTDHGIDGSIKSVGYAK